MNKLLKLGAAKWFILAIGLLLGFSYFSFSAHPASAHEDHEHGHMVPTNATELINLVKQTDAGWDWVPRCGDGAVWDIHSESCKGGTGNGHPTRYQESYGITNAQDLIQKVVDVNAGWDWQPRCGDHAHWTWSDGGYCKGGTGN